LQASSGPTVSTTSTTLIKDLRTEKERKMRSPRFKRRGSPQKEREKLYRSNKKGDISRPGKGKCGLGKRDVAAKRDGRGEEKGAQSGRRFLI